MAKQEVKSNDPQNRQTNEQSLARNASSRQLALPYAYPFGFGLTQGDLLRMNPFALMRRMTEEMDRAFSATPSHGSAAVWMPAIEVTQRDGKYIVSAELPGVDPKSVKVEVVQDAIVLEGERESKVEETRGSVHLSELHYGNFYRSIPLPDGANADQARARFENGVLEITVPVKEGSAQRRQVPIESAMPHASSQTASASHPEAGRTA